jgi:hypothetical protein
MWYFVCIVIGACFGFIVCALLNAAAIADARDARRCKDCLHSRPLPEDVPHIFPGFELNCTACRGEDYSFPGLNVSVVKANAFCDEYVSGYTEGGETNGL